MRQRNHCSSSKGIPKMKLQASEPSGPESLQSQTRPCLKKRLSISRLGVVHRRLRSQRHDVISHGFAVGRRLRLEAQPRERRLRRGFQLDERLRGLANNPPGSKSWPRLINGGPRPCRIGSWILAGSHLCKHLMRIPILLREFGSGVVVRPAGRSARRDELRESGGIERGAGRRIRRRAG
jgi:hypothetical protein